MSDTKPVYYSEYLQLDRLLSSQTLESEKAGQPVHDEHLFIIVHQAYELWFRQILWDVDAVLAVFRAEQVDERSLGHTVSLLHRVVEIQRLLIRHIDVLETMTPLDFLDFREHLTPASGFQSVQFRLIENKLGMLPDSRIPINQASYLARFRDGEREQIEASEDQPSLFALVDRWLARTPFLQFGDWDFWREYKQAVEKMLARERTLIQTNEMLTRPHRDALLKRFGGTMETFEALFDRDRYEGMVDAGEHRLSYEALLAALLINLYRDEPILQLPFRFLTTLMDLDEQFTTWRYRHALMAHRMIGTKVGTGGTAGSDYLRETAEKSKVFTDLFALSTFYNPRSDLPDLPPDVARHMSFQFTGGNG
jgi:tryptophan 2,3-dioxygenase